MNGTKTINIKVILGQLESDEISMTFDPNVDNVKGFLQEKLLIESHSIKNVLIKDSLITG